MSIYAQHEVRVLGFTLLKSMMPLAQKQAKAYMHKNIKDPVLREKLTPDYGIGCKRILISNNYYKAFNQDNVALETHGISHIEEDGVVLKNGEKVVVDAIIYGTGFKATDFLSPIKITGLKGKSLNKEWEKGAEAYLGITVKDFPNFYMLYGPNTNLGHNSIVYMLESQIRYTLKSIKLLNKSGVKYLNIRENKHDLFNEKIQKKVKNTVWEQGCESWYKTDEGKNTVNWPDFTFKYRHKTRNVKLNDYHVIKKAS
jgi:cation diffusion facilitator CzcD-associated flavoprotein CzcO